MSIKTDNPDIEKKPLLSLNEIDNKRIISKCNKYNKSFPRLLFFHNWLILRPLFDSLDFLILDIVFIVLIKLRFIIITQRLKTPLLTTISCQR